MIKVHFYICSNDRKRIKKTLGGAIGGAITCVLKENTSILEPSIRIQKSALGDNYAMVNYAYIPEFGRYYFVSSPIVETGQAVTYNLQVDPLMSYCEDLRNTKFEIARAEKEGNGYYIDTERALQNRKVVSYEVLGHIPQDQSGKKYAITVAGGV